MQVVKEFRSLLNPYYWRTALLIARNNLSRQYRNSFLGLLWTLLQPLTQVVVYCVIMPHIMRMPPGNNSYVLFIVVSVPLWSFIAQTLVQSSHSIITQAETLKRCIISSTLFPIADILRLTYIYFLSFGTMYAFSVLFMAPFHPYALLMPLYFIPVLVCVFSLGIAIAFLAPYMRDISELLQVATSVMFWMTPVVYPISVLPEFGQRIMQWNPFYILMHPIQQVAYEHVLPSMDSLRNSAVVMLLSIAVSYAVYRKCRRNYVYYF